jgi:hypothetical protein
MQQLCWPVKRQSPGRIQTSTPATQSAVEAARRGNSRFVGFHRDFEPRSAFELIALSGYAQS